MSSAHWDESLAERYRQHHYEFPDKSLAGKTVVVAGGTGGLGSALEALLAREGAKVIAGYRANRERAESLGRAMDQQFGANVEFVAWDILEPGVRAAFVDAVTRGGQPLAGAAIFPGEPARVAFEALSREAISASVESNFTGPLKSLRG